MKNNTYVIAELSANHGHDLQIALDSIDAAKECGADAIKIQTYTADTMTLDCNKEDFMVQGGTLWDGMSLYELYQQAYTPWEWHQEIFEYARRLGIACFSTPFDTTAIDFLETLGNPIYKIASFEITDINLIEYAALTGKPILMSTGIATLEDIELAIETCYNAGNRDITLLKCTSAYPAPIEKANLLTIPDMAVRFPGVKIGVSDHSMSNTIAITAVALGATVVEKHLIIDRAIGGPDSTFSMEPIEFKAMVDSIREVEKALGCPIYPTDVTTISGREFSRSLFVCQDMKEGDELTLENLRSIRPNCGLHPKYLKELLGKKVNRSLEKGTPMELIFTDL